MSLLLLAALCASSLAAPNPVLPHVADAGVLHHAGKYYVMGVGTSGHIRVSDDLVHWSGPIHAFSMDNTWATGPAGEDREIHACDFILHNGQFHLYWSVNHGPLRQIGHAVASRPLGPYQEPVRTEPFDGRIDPQCFRDQDGRLYFYTVKFGIGNLIWGQEMHQPSERVGMPKRLLSAQRNTWENLDQDQRGILPILVNEAPFVVRHRDRYYLLYNANHTAPEHGNYGIGVAVADSPLGFNDRSKYPFPVIRSNQDPKHADVAVASEARVAKNAGQPNLVRGPNGFAWWLVYFADAKHRSQHIDRAHFFGVLL